MLTEQRHNDKAKYLSALDALTFYISISCPAREIAAKRDGEGIGFLTEREKRVSLFPG